MNIGQTVQVPFCGNYRLHDGRDPEVCEQFIHRINDIPEPFGRAAENGHVTGSAIVLNRSRDKILLTHHAKLDRLLQLGGHCEGIRDPLYTAYREAYEESGLTSITVTSLEVLDLDIHLIPKSRKQVAHLHYDVRYLFEADPQEPLTVSAESKSLGWFDLTEFLNITEDDSLKRAIEKSHAVDKQ